VWPNELNLENVIMNRLTRLVLLIPLALFSAWWPPPSRDHAFFFRRRASEYAWKFSAGTGRNFLRHNGNGGLMMRAPSSG